MTAKSQAFNALDRPAHPTRNPGDVRRVFGHAGACPSKLKGKRQSASNHSEIVTRPVDYTPADVVKPAHVAHDSVLHAKAELAHQLAFTSRMFGECHRVERVWCRRI